MEKGYCDFCKDLVSYKKKKVNENYSFRNKDFKVKETKMYCSICGNEVCSLNLDKDLENIYNGYLNLYGLSLDSFIKIRKSLNLSQELFAYGLRWSKKSIIRYENREEIPSVEYLNTYKRLKENKDYFLDILRLNKDDIEEDIYYKIINKINLNVDYKSRNTILYLLKGSKLYMMQILKCLFACDFLSYKNKSHAITSFKYAKLPYGPVVDNYKIIFDIMAKSGELKLGDLILVNGDVKSTYEINVEPDLKVFDAQDIQIMDEIKQKLSKKTAKELSDWSHDFKGWRETKVGGIINYEKYAKYFEF